VKKIDSSLRAKNSNYIRYATDRWCYEHNKKLKDFADAAEMPPETLSRIRRGRVSPSDVTYSRIKDVCGFDPIEAYEETQRNITEEMFAINAKKKEGIAFVSLKEVKAALESSLSIINELCDVFGDEEIVRGIESVKPLRVSFTNRRGRKENAEIRELIRQKGLFHWEVADLLGVSENTVYRKLRSEIPEEEKQRWLELINGVPNKQAIDEDACNEEDEDDQREI